MKLDPAIVLRKLSELFKFLADLPLDSFQTVSVMTGRRRRVMGTKGSVLLHVEVPFQSDNENAARCLTKPRWTQIRAKLRQTHQALKNAAAPQKKNQNLEAIIQQVFAYHRPVVPESSSSEEEEESSQGEESWQSEVSWGSEREIVLDTDGESVVDSEGSSFSSSEEEEETHHAVPGILALRAQLAGVKRVAPPVYSHRAPPQKRRK